MRCLFIIFAFALLSFSSDLVAVDLSEFKQKCESIGFKKGTEKFGDCVLKLRDRVKGSQQAIQQQQQAAQQRQLQAQRQREELNYIRQQQALLKKQQEAQESENLFKSLMMIGQGLDMMNGTGAYAPNVNTGYQSKGLGLIDSYQSGMNKVCVYDTITGREIKTLKNSLSICPLTP